MSKFTFNIFSLEVRRQVTLKTLAKNETLFVEGSRADAIYFVDKGSIRLVLYPQDGKQMVLYRAREGEPFAEEHLSLGRYIYGAVADTKSVVKCAPKRAVLTDIDSNAISARRFINCLSGRYYKLRNNFERLGITPAKKRVLHLLATLCDENGYCRGLSGKLKSLSDDLNLSHEAMYRALKDLETEDSIRRTKGSIQVLSFPSGR